MYIFDVIIQELKKSTKSLKMQEACKHVFCFYTLDYIRIKIFYTICTGSKDETARSMQTRVGMLVGMISMYSQWVWSIVGGFI